MATHLQDADVRHVNLSVALDSYFESMGWDQATGLPTPEKLASLDLAWLQ